ncbi:hypothetical protein K5X82_18230 [Halosquirtibacter xylanolyticus]|uniref:hypothetical protein n=1 Tax=Halosquirtibacter xylanolyticus TaxID=3374599 RepID=UPI00374A8B86|nr:hypothetical protein K5X82_18230 [Prolixibacteraceae bacterium]
MRLFRSGLLLVAIFACTTLFAQENTTATTANTAKTTTAQTSTTQTKKAVRKPRPKFTLMDKTIDQQFDLIYNRSTKYQEYKVVKITWYQDLHKNIKDSLSAKTSLWKEANTETIKLKAKVETLNNELTQTKQNLEEVTNQKDSLGLFGMLVEKSTYQTILWSIIVVLIILTVVSFLLFKRAHVVTNKTQEKLNDIQEEFETHRKRALEREQVLARKLHTEQRKNQSF